MSVRDYLLAFWKTFVVTATGLVVTWLANRGIHLSDEAATAFTIAAVAAGLAAYNLVVNWLLARAGDSLIERLLRLLGKLLSLGGKPPVYPDEPPTPAPVETGARRAQ